MNLPRLPKFPSASPACLVVAMALATLAGACGGASPTDVRDDGAATVPADAKVNILTGDISIEGAFELSHIPSSRVVVRLEEISLADAPSVVIAEQAHERVTTLPLSYELTWTGELDPERHYSIAASVYDGGGELIFWTDTVFPVFPGDTKIDFTIVSVHLN